MTLPEMESLRRPGRAIRGISALLLPYSQGRMDEAAFQRHLQRTRRAGLRVAVNMDTGYGDLLTAAEKTQVLAWTRAAHGAGDWFAAGALPAGLAAGLGVAETAAAYLRAGEEIRRAGGVPMIFPSPATAAFQDDELLDFFARLGAGLDRFLGFELGTMFNPNGRLFSPAVLEALMALPSCEGLKHSSLSRAEELERLRLRDRLRPEFIIYTGNDVALDMVEYGSDYLLGLSTFAPEVFAARDRAWRERSSEYLELRDALQYLGWLGFRAPVPAYKHSAALFLHATGHLGSPETHPRAPRREAWDAEALRDAARRLAALCPEVLAPGAGL